MQTLFKNQAHRKVQQIRIEKETPQQMYNLLCGLFAHPIRFSYISVKDIPIFQRVFLFYLNSSYERGRFLLCI